ncbi:MAG TPA: hypothetical protein VMD30_13855, partial [Tepidisphaeraceae bacterium]|nr:hypothetical protein [Tepidisphaeraceae bacterium]
MRHFRVWQYFCDGNQFSALTPTLPRNSEYRVPGEGEKRRSPIYWRAQLLLALVVLVLIVSCATAQTTQPATQPVAKGWLSPKYIFASSKIFPGTTRTYRIYVPAQYNPAKPACLFVDQDSVQFNAPAVFDRLIAAGGMPITIAVFVSPGVVPAANKHALPRYNRSYEYDSLNDNYVNF